MATKEKTGGKLLHFPRRDSVNVSRRAFVAAVETAAGFLLGAVLTGAEIFGRYAPFGVAAVAASGSGMAGFCTMVGACLGYLCLEGLTDGMRYAAAAILTYSVAFAFYDTRLYQSRWFMPGIASLLSAMTGFVCRAGAGWHGEDLVFFVTEVLLTGAAARCYTTVFNQWPGMLDAPLSLSPRQVTGLLMLSGSVLMALGRVEILGIFSMGRLLAAVGILAAARRGVGEGVLVGACAGAALDLSAGTEPYCCMVFTLAGLVCGLCRERGKLIASGAYVLAVCIVLLWTWEGSKYGGILLESVIGSIIFLFLPLPGASARTPRSLSAAEGGQEALRWMLSQRINALAEAFRGLHETLQETLRSEEFNRDNPADIFARTADRVCVSCVLRQTCWQKDYEDTRRACNDAVIPMMERGRLLATDFPGVFSARCINFSQWIAEANRELTAFLRRRQTLRRTRQTGRMLCSQYAQVDQLMARAAAEFSVSLTPDLPRQARLEAFLKSMNLSGGCVYYDSAGHLLVETPDTEELRGHPARRELAEVLGTPLREWESTQGRLVFAQAEPFRAMVAMEGAPRRAESISGDTGTWFRREDGMLFLLLCDGMGSGPMAQGESAGTAKLIESFLRAGMEPEQALETVSGALTLRGDESGSSTADLLAVDLFSGRCRICKQGAAPTYVCRGGKVKCAAGHSLPAGILPGPQARSDSHTFRGETGDWILLITDGILCGKEDDWLRELLAGYEGTSPGELAGMVLRAGREHCQGEDDATVIAVHLEAGREA